MNNKQIDQISSFWIFLYKWFSPFKFLWNGSNNKDGGDVYEERCTIGGNRRKNKNDNICS